MFFLYILFGIVILYMLLALFSTLKIEIYNTRLSTEKIDNRHINKNYKVIVSLCVFNIKIFKLNVTKDKLEKNIIRENVDKFKKKLKEDKNNFDIKSLKFIKDLNIKIEKLKLDIRLGIEDAEATAILVGGVSGVIANLIKDVNNQKFLVLPVYGKNILNVSIESIITIKMIHIIYIIYNMKKVRRKENVRTSNRRPYVNGYE